MDISKKRQVRNLLSIFAGAAGLALIVSLFMIYNYGPNGRYFLKNVLLEPSTTISLSFDDLNPKTKASSRYIFDGINFTYYDAAKKLVAIKVSPGQYAQFFQATNGDESLAQVPGDILSLFTIGTSAKLVLSTKTESDASWQFNSKPLQEVQFAKNGDYFRIQLRESTASVNAGWVYFHHPHVYQTASSIFSPASGL